MPFSNFDLSLFYIPNCKTDPSNGYFRFCGVPTGKLVLVRASSGKLMATTTVTIPPRPHPVSTFM